ncbi:MAG TPA: glutathione S-transferase family protein [Candidatus Limnocylindria bacterium]|nr:glutathione S-transferase family protein [Candidatus Limnocylindria bacterium]
MITLYGVTRSRALRCLWMLEELGIPYEHVKTAFGPTGSRTPEFLRINPNGHIPAMTDGELTLWESLAINLYLARKYGPALWPATPEDEGRAYMWSIWAMTELEEPVITVFLNRVMLPEAQRNEAAAKAAAERFLVPLRVLDGALAGREYLLGSTFSVADLNVAGVLMTAPLSGLSLDGAPNAAAWLSRTTQRPALQRALAR